MNRKQFLYKASLFLGSLLATACQTPFLTAPRPRRQDCQERILVLGGGMSGITAARYLYQQGYDVLVLEGRQRLGGRIHTDFTMGMPVDLGAAWMHGIIRNPVAHIVDDWGKKKLYTNFDNLSMYYTNGNELTEEELETALGKQYELMNAMVKYVRDGHPDISVWDFFQKVSREKKWDNNPLYAWGLRATVASEFGASLQEISLHSLLLDGEDGLSGGDHLPEGGYQPVVEHMAQGLQIQYGAIAKEIHWGKQGIQVKCEGNRNFKADRLICTVPLGVLKAKSIRFSPVLPVDKQRAIKRLGMGHFNKVVLQYDKVFWPDDIDIISLVDLQAEPINYVNMAMYGGHPVLVGMVGQMPDSKISDEEIVSIQAKKIQKIFQSKQEPVKGIVTRWGDNPFSRGSYSYIPVGTKVRERQVLAKPLAERLFFAGEATESSYPSTVHGAFYSGLREAKRLVNSICQR
ncbi:MAG: FAD-dependent oxidoreductase [Spirochaetota bacterium]